MCAPEGGVTGIVMHGHHLGCLRGPRFDQARGGSRIFFEGGAAGPEGRHF